MPDITASVTAAMAAPAAPKASIATTSAPMASVEAKEAPSVPLKAKEAPESTPKATTPPEPPRKHKVKVDNEDVEVDEDELKRGYAHNKAANKRFEEGAALRKQAEQAFAMLKDPAQLRKLLEDPRVGVDVRKFAEEYLWEKIQYEALTPEQKRQKEVDHELEKYRSAEKERAEAGERAEAEQLQAKYADEYEQKILTALQQGSIPNTRGAVRRMAQYLQLSLANNLDVSPSDLVARVRQDLIEEHKSMYGAGDATTLLSILGEDLAAKIRDADLKRLKSTQPASQRKPAGNAKPARPPERRRGSVSADAFAAMLTEKLKP